MDVNFPEWVGVLGAVLSVALALGAALALVRGSYNKARIQALREDNDDLRARVGDLDSEIERRKLKEETLSARIDSVANENQLLRDMVTQRAEVDKVFNAINHHNEVALRELSEHHDAAMRAWTQVSEALQVLLDEKRSA